MLLKSSGFLSNLLLVNWADAGPGDLCQRCFELGLPGRAPCLRPELPADGLAGARAAAEPGLPAVMLPALPGSQRAAPVGFVPVWGRRSPPPARPWAPGCPASFTDREPLRSGVCCEAWQGLTPKPHAPFDGVGPTSPNLKRHPGLSVRPGRKEPRWPRTPCAGSSRRRWGSACRGTGLPFGSRSSAPCVPGTPAPWSPVPGAPPRLGIPP